MYRALAILTIIAAVAVALKARARCGSGDIAPDRGAVRAVRAVRAVQLLFLVCLALMTLSGIVVLALGLAMRGWMLLLHMAVAPLFAIAIAALALLWAHRTSTCLRLLLLSGFVAITSAIFMMMTWFGTDWQRWLLNVHRVSSMVLVIAAAGQARRGWPVRQSTVAGTADSPRAVGD